MRELVFEEWAYRREAGSFLCGNLVDVATGLHRFVVLRRDRGDEQLQAEKLVREAERLSVKIYNETGYML